MTALASLGSGVSLRSPPGGIGFLQLPRSPPSTLLLPRSSLNFSTFLQLLPISPPAFDELILLHEVLRFYQLLIDPGQRAERAVERQRARASEARGAERVSVEEGDSRGQRGREPPRGERASVQSGDKESDQQQPPGDPL